MAASQKKVESKRLYKKKFGYNKLWIQSYMYMYVVYTQDYTPTEILFHPLLLGKNIWEAHVVNSRRSVQNSLPHLLQILENIFKYGMYKNQNRFIELHKWI